MKGKVLDYSVQENAGVIAGDDGERYTFKGSEWKEDSTPSRGMSVDFDQEGTSATGVYKALGASGSSGGAGAKNKMTAGLLAIFLGGFGAHKFYLGYTGPALVFLLTNTVGWTVTWILAGLPNVVLGLIAFIEGIMYLTKTDEEFEELYVQGTKSWF